MKTYKVISPSGVETHIQANTEDELLRYGFTPAPETKAKQPATKQAKPAATKEA